MNLSPIALFVYNRLAHTILTMEALQKNRGASESILYIFSDGPKNFADEERVAAVRNYLKGIAGFAKVILVENNQNIGLARSITHGIDTVLSNNPSVIVLEDDLVTSPYFLQFMNDALNMYADNHLVASVQGYFPPVGSQIPDIFFLRYVGCWGWGTWGRAWQLFESDSERLLGELNKKRLSRVFDVGGYPFTRMLERQIEGKLDSWAIRWHTALFLADKLNLYPGISLVQNIGHDGSGVHCNRSSHFDVTLANSPVSVCYQNPLENTFAHKALANYFREIHPSFMKKIVQVTRLLLFSSSRNFKNLPN